MGSLFELASAQVVNYSRNQPKKLFDMAKDAVGDLAELAAKNLSVKITEQDWIGDIEDFVKGEIFPLSNYLYNDLPITCVEELQETIHDRMVKFHQQISIDHENESGTARVPTEVMTYMSLHPHMPVLDVSRFPTFISINAKRIWIGNLISDNLDKMFHVRSFSSWVPQVTSSSCVPPSLLINTLVNFAHLEVFKYDQATDELIRELVDCCPKLRVVNLNNSKITDLGARYLHQLKYLQCVYIDNTGVTLDGCTKLMLKLQIAKPSISNNSLNSIINNLKVDDKSTRMKSAHFPNFLTTGQLSKTVLSFPNLTQLSLNYEEQRTFPPEDQLILQKDLLSLDLLVLENGAGLVDTEVYALKTVARLHLLNVKLIDVEQMKMINDLFPNLKELVISQCRDGMHNNDIYSPSDVLFPNLEKFYCKNIVAKYLVSSVLSHCQHIKEITIVAQPRCTLFDDSWFECLLMTNPMCDLQIFQGFTNSMTMKSVMLVFSRCRKLRELNMRFGSLADLAKIEFFKRAIKVGNFNLKVNSSNILYRHPM